MDKRLTCGGFLANSKKFVDDELGKENKKIVSKTEEFIGRTYEVVDK